MTTVHAQVVGDRAVLPRAELERLLELARRTEEIRLEILNEEDLPANGIAQLAQSGHAFDWLADENDIYSVNDLKVRYR